jgi:GT2 family glycosyltransferase
MNLTVVLVNYKCDKAKLQSCINSIKINTDVLIIDHSHDFTFDNLTVPQNLNIKVIKNINLGNGAGINCGIKIANTKLVLYLDIDTVLSPNFFEKLNNSIQKINDFTVIAPKINGFYKDLNINKTGNLSLFKFYYNKLFFNLDLEKKNLSDIKQVFLLVVQ